MYDCVYRIYVRVCMYEGVCVCTTIHVCKGLCMTVCVKDINVCEGMYV